MNLIGKNIDGRYQILEEVGKGGMARVYKSRDKQLNRLVALKVLKEDYKDDKEFIRRFNVEAQAAASLSNPHIVSIYDVGCEDGLHYIVMELVEGETLKEYIERAQVIPWREAADFSIQICEGIAEAHKNSVIHRDIKPQNIIMTPDGTLKITDFGIARATTQATMTMVNNNTIGTAHYLSPEQARGGYTDERTDIYSLGVVMYEMLTGRLPFDDDSPVAIAIKHLQENPTMITQINPDVPKEFERIVSKAMSKEQDSRYASAYDMIRDLDNVLRNSDSDLNYVSRQKRTFEPEFDNFDNTIKMPKIDDTGVLGTVIPGYDLDNLDEQDAEYEAMERMNENRARRIKKKKDRKVAFIAFLSALTVLAVGVAVTYALTDGFGFISTESETTEVPNLVGMTLNDAQKKYKQTFSIIEANKAESTKPVGTILEQTPNAGLPLRNSDNVVINVIVSSGSSSVTLTDYTGLNSTEVKEIIEKLGLKCTIREEVNSDFEKGTVYDQNPKAGSTVSSGDMVTIFVSKEPNGTPQPENTPDNKPTEKPELAASPKPVNTEKPEPTTVPEPTQKPKPTTAPAPIEDPDPDPVQVPDTGTSGSDGSSGTGTGSGDTSDLTD